MEMVIPALQGCLERPTGLELVVAPAILRLHIIGMLQKVPDAFKA